MKILITLITNKINFTLFYLLKYVYVPLRRDNIIRKRNKKYKRVLIYINMKDN